MRNKGLELLGAEYVAFLDADDFWEPDMLQTLISAAKEHDCDVAQCRFIYDFSSGRTALPLGAFNWDTFLQGRRLRRAYVRMMTGINMNHVCMKLIKTHLFAGLRFDTRMKTAEDLKMRIDLFMHVEKYCFVNKALYHYRRSEPP